MDTMLPTIFDSIAWLAQNAANLMIQTTLLIAIGLMTARLLRNQGSAVQSAIYRGTLIAVLICPLMTSLLSIAGVSGWMLKLPKAQLAIASKDDSATISEKAIDKSANQFTGLRDDGDKGSRQPLKKELDPFEPSGGDSCLLDENFDPVKIENSVISDEPQTQPVATSENVTETKTTSLTPTVSNTTSILPFFYLGIALIWICGSLLMMVRLYIAYCRTQMLRNCSHSASEFEMDACKQLAERIGVNAPEVRKHPLISSPCLLGIFSPIILLPAEIDQKLQLQKAFAHELAHLRRRDTFWNLAQRLALVAYFFQPLMWRLVYRLETSAEEVCDDFVVRHCLDRKGYAQQLVDLAEFNLLPDCTVVGMFTRRHSSLHGRIVRILDTTRKISTHVSLPTLFGIAILVLFAATLGGFLGNEYRPQYAATLIADASENAEESEQNVDQAADSFITFSGIVIDDKNQPMVAEVFVEGIDTKIQTKVDGKFKIEVGEKLVSGRSPIKIFAVADGFGLAVAKLVGSRRANLQLQLAPDDHPVRGKLIDTEGNPIEGAVVRVKELSFLEEGIQNYLDIANGSGATQQQLPQGIRFNDKRIQPVTTDAQGEFTIRNIGSGRAARIEVFGETCAYQQFTALTADVKKVSVLSSSGGLASQSSGTLSIHGCKPLISCGPSQPIEGIVIDRDTKKPLTGIEVYEYKMNGQAFAGMRALKATTDERGRFRLIGLPTGKGNILTVLPNLKNKLALPYFMEYFPVPSTADLRPIEMEIGLKRGVMIRGKVVNKQTQEPIADATVSYKPYLDNRAAGQLELFTKHTLGRFRDFTETNAKGEYRVVGTPGKGIVEVIVWKTIFPSGQGCDQIEDHRFQPNGYLKIYGFPSGKRNSTAVREVAIENENSVGSFDFKIDPGKKVRFRFVDDQDLPVQNVAVSCARRTYTYSTGSDEFEATGLMPNQKERFVFKNFERQLGTSLEVSGKSRSPIEVNLKPMSVVRGKLVDENGDAVNGASIGYPNPYQQVFSDKNGTFEILAVPSVVRISAQSRNRFCTIAANLKINEGEHIDLGTIDITKKSNQQVPKRTRLNSVPQKNSSNKSSNQQAEKTATVTGLVVNDKNQPVSNVSVSHGKYETTSNSRGQFELEIPRDVLDRFPNAGKVISAQKQGFGLTASTFDPKKSNDVRIQLVSDANPIEGTLIDQQGDPVAGATVNVDQIIIFKDVDLGKRLRDAKTDPNVLENIPRAVGQVGDHIKPVISDANGKFVIHGIGSGRLAHLSILGTHTAHLRAVVATANVDRIKSEHARSLSYRDSTIHGCKLTLVCEPSQPVEGTLIDRDTKKPIAGIKVTANHIYRTSPGSFFRDRIDAIAATTNAEGKFRLMGLPTNAKIQIVTLPQDSLADADPYLPATVDIPEGRGAEPIHMTVPLQRGIWIRGRVFDDETGQAIRSLFLGYRAFPDNKFASELTLESQREVFARQIRVNSKGEFRFVGLPGPGLIYIPTIYLADGNYPKNQGYRDVPKNRVDESGILTIASRYISNVRALKTINPNENGIKVDFRLHRGTSVRIRTLDPEGNRISNVETRIADVRSRFQTQDSSEFELNGFPEDGHQTVIFQIASKRLGRVQRIAATKSSPVSVRLQRMAKFSASLTDAQDPSAPKSIHFQLLSNHRPVYRVEAEADSNGKIEQYLVPGEYLVSLDQYGTRGFKKIEVTAGDDFDLGAINIGERFGKNLMSPPMPMAKFIRSIPSMKSDQINKRPELPQQDK